MTKKWMQDQLSFEFTTGAMVVAFIQKPKNARSTYCMSKAIQNKI